MSWVKDQEMFFKKKIKEEKERTKMNLIKKGKTKVAKTVVDGMTVSQEALSEVSSEKFVKVRGKVLKVFNFALIAAVCAMGMGMCYAEGDAAATVITQMIDIICKVFRYVGVVLAVYSIGQLVMAFKNEDADSKSRATTMLVVAGVLIGIDALVAGLNLTSYL